MDQNALLLIAVVLDDSGNQTGQTIVLIVCTNYILQNRVNDPLDVMTIWEGSEVASNLYIHNNSSLGKHCYICQHLTKPHSESERKRMAKIYRLQLTRLNETFQIRVQIIQVKDGASQA